MDIKFLKRNVRNSQRLTNSFINSIKYLILNYEKWFRPFFKKNTLIIKYKLSEPYGVIKLLQRFNRGSDNYIFSEVFIENGYDIKIIPAPLNILDIGANVGYTSIYFKKQYPQADIVCIEPMEDNLRVLKTNLAMNNINIDVLEGAISTHPGHVYMENGTKDYDFHISSNPKKMDLKVAAYTVDDILLQKGWVQIDLIKMDIEGYEKELFTTNCEWLSKVNNLIIEAHHPHFTEDDVIQMVKKHQFKSYSIINGLFFVTRV